MTVQSTVSQQKFTGDGVSKVFPFAFKFEDRAHMFARYVLDGPAYTNLVQGVDFTVSPPGPSGAITTSVAVPSGTTIQVYRVVPLTQLTDLVTNDSFPAESVEVRLDLLTEMIQQVNDQLSGSTPSGGGGNTTIINNLGLAGLVNSGSGYGVYASTTDNVASLRSLQAGSNVSLTITGGAIRIDAATSVTGALLASNNLSDVASNQTARNTLLGGTVNGYVMTYNGSNWVAAPSATGSSGEANTASNLGSGSDLYKQKVGVDLQFRRINAGAGITVTQNANDITVAASATSGEANTASNIGVSGQGIYASKSGVDLRFKGLAAGLGIAVTSNGTDVTHSVNQAASLTWAAKQKFNSTSADVPVIAGYGIPITADSPSVSHTRTSPATTAGVNSIGVAQYIGLKANPTSRSFEWAQAIVLDNYSTVVANTVPGLPNYSTQNVGSYIKAYKRDVGQTWGQCIECQDTSGDTNTTMFGTEYDLLSNGNVTGFRRGIAMYYGNTTVAGTPGTPPGPAIGQTLWDIGLEIYPTNYGNARMTKGLNLGGTFLQAVIDMVTLVNTPVAIDMAGGTALKFRSGTGGSPTPTWYSGAFTPTWVGAIRVLVDGSTFYQPVCSNHP